MTSLLFLIKRNCKLFFKDKGMFFTSLITPAILLVLYVTFLGNVYEDSFKLSMPEGFTVSQKLIKAAVGGQLFSSLLAVCSVTVAFCSNLLMVNDKITGAKRDLTMTPVKPSTMALGYYISTVISTLIVCLTACGLVFMYLANVGWYLSTVDVLLILLDVLLLVLFGTALSTLINIPLSTPGQASAVGTIISSGYGFICGAYMPISQFSEGLQRVILFLPGTYGTALLKNHTMRGVFEEMSKQNIPDEAITGIKNVLDCNIYFFDNKVNTSDMYLVLAASILVAVALLIILNRTKKSKLTR